MDEQLAKQLEDLRGALIEAIQNSERLAEVLARLRESGREVQFMVDAMLVDKSPEETDCSNGSCDRSKEVPFTSVDRLFLQALRISSDE